MTAISQNGLPMKRSLTSLISSLASSDNNCSREQHCLECGQTLTSRGARLQVCLECRAVWVAPSAFESLVEAPEGALEDLLGVDANSQNTHQATESGRGCPACGEVMQNYEYGGLWLDACQSGHGVWLDPGELELLRQSATVAR